jgi:A/G-specific adenine glycosylase
LRDKRHESRATEKVFKLDGSLFVSDFSFLDFRQSLLGWYDQQRRSLPWRETRDPYRVWLSEIMLQQTRVAAVIEHYHEFLRRFPTIENLAKTREASVLAAWSGLGYYRRARMLHKAAKQIVREGKFPQTSAALRDLPGIGRYTAAAVASIAFDEPVAVVDGNVERLLLRLTGKRLAAEDCWKAATELLEVARPGDFNQAMMELGAVICTPRAPACLTCPVIEWCATRGELQREAKPSRQKKKEIHFALHRRERAILLVQRAQGTSLMPGMWELPEVEQGRALAVQDDEPLFTLRHAITVTDYKVRVWSGDASVRSSGKWIATDRLNQVALTGLARKILRKAKIL